MEQTRLRIVREAKGLGLRETARLVGLDPSHLSRIERGLSEPSASLLLRLAITLGVAHAKEFKALGLLEPIAEGRRRSQVTSVKAQRPVKEPV